VPDDHLLREPAANVLKSRSTVKPLVVSACGLGMCAAFADDIKNSSETMTDAVGKTLSPIINLYQKLRSDIFEVAERLVDEGYDAPKQEIRVAVNNLLIRLAAVCMTVSKGRGFLQSRPEQRLLREAMFFLVWSLPDEGRAATIEALVGRSDP
jgi:alkylation response protein AidB-like acyl-CoA dehydrogenase